MTNRRGVTLFETMIAFLVVGLVATSAMEAVSAEMRGAERARRALETQALASSRLDFLQLLTDADLQALPDSVESGEFEAPMNEYAWHMTSDPDQDQPGVYHVAITVTWPGNAYVVRTSVYRRPPVITPR